MQMEATWSDSSTVEVFCLQKENTDILLFFVKEKNVRNGRAGYIPPVNGTKPLD